MRVSFCFWGQGYNCDDGAEVFLWDVRGRGSRVSIVFFFWLVSYVVIV